MSGYDFELASDCFFDLCFLAIIVLCQFSDRLTSFVSFSNHFGGKSRSCDNRSSCRQGWVNDYHIAEYKILYKIT